MQTRISSYHQVAEQLHMLKWMLTSVPELISICSPSFDCQRNDLSAHALHLHSLNYKNEEESSFTPTDSQVWVAANQCVIHC
jgi:hypothetical protein